METMFSTLPSQASIDYKINKSKPGRKLSLEPAKTKRNEQVRNAQRKYRAKNKQRLETLEVECTILKDECASWESKYNAMREEVAILKSQLKSKNQHQLPVDAGVPEFNFDSIKSCFTSSSATEVDLSAIEKAGESVSDLFIDSLYSLLKQDEGLTANVSESKYEFVHVNDETANLTNIKMEDFDDYFQSVDQNLKDKSRFVFDSHLMDGAVSVGEIFNSNSNEDMFDRMNKDEFYNSGNSNDHKRDYFNFNFNDTQANEDNLDDGSLDTNIIINNCNADETNECDDEEDNIKKRRKKNQERRVVTLRKRQLVINSSHEIKSPIKVPSLFQKH